MQDLEFRADGALFGFCNQTLFVVNVSTGQASPVGTDPYAGTTTTIEVGIATRGAHRSMPTS